MRRCKTCGQSKPTTAYTSHPGAVDGLRAECKPCRAKTVREARAARPERHVLTLMIQRCHNSKHAKFRYWGGRGIAVAPEWRTAGGFASFFAHVGPRPSPKHEIDRKDNDRGYEPGNVRWATRSEQMLNTRRTVMITAFGKTQPLRAWATETGLTQRCLEWRREQGWAPEAILATPRHRSPA
jgi:hypothetical protein